MVGTINVAGQFMGSPLGGYFSDRYRLKSYFSYFNTQFLLFLDMAVEHWLHLEVR